LAIAALCHISKLTFYEDGRSINKNLAHLGNFQTISLTSSKMYYCEKQRSESEFSYACGQSDFDFVYVHLQPSTTLHDTSRRYSDVTDKTEVEAVTLYGRTFQALCDYLCIYTHWPLCTCVFAQDAKNLSRRPLVVRGPRNVRIKICVNCPGRVVM
jgi:hypothetical protein